MAPVANTTFFARICQSRSRGISVAGLLKWSLMRSTRPTKFWA
jgi:hypothetical protein